MRRSLTRYRFERSVYTERPDRNVSQGTDSVGEGRRIRVKQLDPAATTAVAVNDGMSCGAFNVLYIYVFYRRMHAQQAYKAMYASGSKLLYADTRCGHD